MTTEHFFTCPYCWEEISMVFDLSAPEQEYVEDCEVCCRPIIVSYTAGEDKVEGFAARSDGE